MTTPAPQFKEEVAGQVRLFSDGTGVILSDVFHDGGWYSIYTRITWALDPGEVSE
jgi:hypothetical protein